MPLKPKQNRSRVKNLATFIQEKSQEEETPMEIDESTDSENKKEYPSSSETELEDEEFFPEEDSNFIDINLISDLVDFVLNTQPTLRWISVLILSVLRYFWVKFLWKKIFKYNFKAI